MNAIITLLDMLLNLAFWVILIQVIMSWLIMFNVINMYQPIVSQIWEGLKRLTEPVYRPIRRILPDMGGIDLAPVIVIILIYVLQTFLRQDLAPMLLR